MDREAWPAVVHGIPKRGTWLSAWTDMCVCVCVYIYIYTHIYTYIIHIYIYHTYIIYIYIYRKIFNFLPLLCPQWTLSSVSVNHQVSLPWTSLYSTSVFSVRIYCCASRLVFSFLWSYLHPLLVYLMQPCDFKCVVAGLNFSQTTVHHNKWLRQGE